MKNRTGMTAAVALVLAAAMMLGACARAKTPAEAYEYPADYPKYGTSDLARNKAGLSVEKEASMEQPDAPDGGFAYAEDDDAKIVWTGTVSMETTAWDETAAALSSLFASYGVQVMNSQERGGTSYYENGMDRKSARYAEYTLRVPSEHFADFMKGFENVKGSVTSSSTSRADMTKQYDENALVIDLLNTEYSELKELMSEAKDLSEILMLRDRMTEVMKEIKILSQTNNTIDYDVQYSRVTLSLREVMVYTDPDKGESWFTRFGKAFTEGASDFADFLGDVAIWFSGHLFYLILAVAIIGLPVFLIARKIRKKKGVKKSRKKVSAEKTEEVPEEKAEA